MPILFRDYETRSTQDLKDVGAWKYATHPATEIWCCAYAVDDGPISLWTPGDPVPPEFIAAAQDPAFVVCAFNDAFERLVEQHIMVPRYGWSIVPIERHRCLQASALALSLPAKLENVAKALGLPQQKDAAGHKLMMQMAQPRKRRRDEDPNGIYWFEDPERVTRLHAYCKQDLAAERALYARVGFLSAEEQALWELDATINARGIYIDGDLLGAAIHVAEQAQQELNAELNGITGGLGVNQVDALLEWLAEHDCVVSSMQKPVLRKALTRAKIPAEARRVIELRLDGAHAAAAKLLTMRDWRNGDGRARHCLRFHGASTGRWSSHGIQLQNMKRPVVEDMGAAIAAVASGDLKHIRSKYPQPMSVIGDITRALICAQPGHRLLVADFSGVESRITAWLSGQDSKLEQWAKYDRTQDPHDEPYFINGHKTFKLPEAEARAPGKTGDLAFGFMGGAGAWKRLAPEGDTSTEEQIEERKRAWRDAHPQTVRFWHALNSAAITAVRYPDTTPSAKRITFKCDATFLRMRLPSGRELSYPFPKLKTNERGDTVVTFMDNEQGKWTECRHGQGAYGGTWIENAVQAVARDLFAAAMPRLEAAGYKIVLHVHDEIVVEAPNGFGNVEEFLQIITTQPDWADGLPIAAKARNGQRFCKTTEPERAQEKPIASDAARDLSAAAGHQGSGAPEITNPEPSVSVEPEQDATLNKQNGGDTHNMPDALVAILGLGFDGEGDVASLHAGGADESDTSGANGSGGSTKGNYNDGAADKDADKPYPPVRAILLAKGYQITQTFPFAVPGTTEPLFYEDRCELKSGLTPTDKRPRKTSRYWHRDKNNEERCDTGSRRIVYNWPAIMQAGPGATVFITEGANKSKPLNDAGLLATAVPYHKWEPECVSALAGHHLIYLADHNPDGGNDPAPKLAADARDKLAPHAASFRLVPATHLWKHLSPGVRTIRQGDDIKDWIEIGGDLTKLLDICREIPADGTRLVYIDMSQWDCEPTPDQEWAVYNRIPLRQCVLFSGEGATGKSTEQLHLTAATVLKRDWLGAMPEQGPAIFIDAEDDDKVIHRRLKAIAAHYDTDITTMIEHGLRLVSWVGCDATLAVASRNGKIEPTSLYKQLLEEASDIKPKMIGIAASANVFAGSENDRAQVQQFVGLLTRIAMAANGAVVLISHPSLTGISTESGLSGTTQWHNSVRARFYLRGVKPTADEPLDTDLREIVFKKNNYGPLSESIMLRWNAGLFLPVGGDDLDQAARQAIAQEVFLSLLKRFHNANRNVSGNKGPGYAPALFAKEDEAKRAGLTSKNLEAAMRQLFKEQKITNEQYGRASNPHYRLIIKP